MVAVQEPETHSLRTADADASRTRELSQSGPFEAVVVMLALALTGTVLGGAAFPTVLVLIDIALGLGIHPRSSDGAYFVAYAMLGGMVGAMIAGGVGLVVATFAAVIAWLSGISHRDVWFASLVGGWTGFFAAHMMFSSSPRAMHLQTIVALATVIGQVGAGGCVLATRKLGGVRLQPVDDHSESRIGLRRLFGITTAVAVLAAVSPAFQGSGLTDAALGLAAVIQAGVIGLALALGRIREAVGTRRST
jgi:hypothetical protein